MTASGSFLSSHSHTVTTRQPSSSSNVTSRKSLSALRLNFSSQYSRLFFGSGRLQIGHRCQKQPFTNMATFRPG